MARWYHTMHKLFLFWQHHNFHYLQPVTVGAALFLFFTIIAPELLEVSIPHSHTTNMLIFDAPVLYYAQFTSVILGGMCLMVGAIWSLIRLMNTSNN